MTMTPLRGRQAEALVNDRAVVDAARVVFAVHGPDAPVSAVAAQAGVGIGSLYRRYPSKESLLEHLCVESMRQLEEVALRALDEPDAWAALTGFVHECVSFRAGAFSATIAGHVAPTPEMRSAAKRGNDLVAKLVERALEQGRLRPDANALDIQLLIELFSRRHPDDGDVYLRLLTIALDGLSAEGPATAMPVAPLTWRRYITRWRTP